MRRRPTRASAAVAASGGLLILLSGPAQARWLAVMGALVLGVAVASLLTRHRLGAARVQVASPERATVGDMVDVVVTVTGSASPLPLHRLELTGAPYGDTAVLVEPVGRGQSARLTARVAARHRGVFHRQSLRLTTGAPFGLMRSDLDAVADCAVEVAAAVVPIPAHVVRSLAGAGDEAAQWRRGPGDEVHAVRDFRSGDALRDVHWRSTARVGRLVVREYEQSVPTRTVVAVAGGAPGPHFETLVAAATSLAHAVWRTGEPLDLLRVAAGDVVATRGASQHGVHTWSASAAPGPTDARSITAAALAEGRPTSVVIVAGPGVTALAEACGGLLGAGADVTVVAAAADLAGLPPSVRTRAVDVDADIAAALAGAA